MTQSPKVDRMISTSLGYECFMRIYGQGSHGADVFCLNSVRYETIEHYELITVRLTVGIHEMGNTHCMQAKKFVKAQPEFPEFQSIFADPIQQYILLHLQISYKYHLS